MNKIDIKSMDINELTDLIVDLGEKKFVAGQIFQWLHSKTVFSFDEMTSISKALKEKLSEKCYVADLEIIDKKISSIDNTRKYLFKVENNYIIESVLMKYSFGNSVCVSTQAGCRMGCTFCASGIDGLERNLTASEILDQVYKIQNDIGERISNIVLMGSGEPFDNYDNVLKFIELINDEKGLNIGQRHITISTCGLVDKILDFADKETQVNLAVSLHAPNDEIRKQTMPIAKKYSLSELLKACKYYTDKTKRRITFEYALIQGLNDSTQNAEELSQKLRGTLCHVNLIPVNNVEERNYKKGTLKSIQVFESILTRNGIQTTIRRELGSDINAACGQLRKKYLESNNA